MARLTASLLALALGAGLAFALAACGEGDARLLPGETAQEISENLDSVQRLVDEGECVEAQGAAQQVSAQVEGLEGIDPKLKRTLEEGAARLNEVVVSCEETTEETLEETVPTIEDTTEEKEEKKDEEPQDKETESEDDQGEDDDFEGSEGSDLPPQANGEAKGHDVPPGEPPVESGPPSGGIGPGAEAEGDD